MYVLFLVIAWLLAPMLSRMPRNVYHKPKGARYAFGSTITAIHRAKASGHDSIDLDMTLDKQGNRWVNHWRLLQIKDSWRIAGARVSRKLGIDELSTAAVRRMRSPWGRILSAYDAMVECRKVGIIPCFEVKPDRRGRVYDVKWWRAFRRFCDKHGFDPVIMSLPMGSHGRRCLQAAHDAGFRTMWLWRPGSVNPPFVDYVKSRPGRGIYAVQKES